MGGQLRAHKDALLLEVKNLDTNADTIGLSYEGWARRYAAEDEMIFILTFEEMYRQQWGQQRWVLKEGASTEFFHAVANERRRRCTI